MEYYVIKDENGAYMNIDTIAYCDGIKYNALCAFRDVKVARTFALIHRHQSGLNCRVVKVRVEEVEE